MRRKSGASVLISIKTGYEGVLDRANIGRLEKPFEDWVDNPRSHHRLQLLVEYLICRHEYGVRFDEALIIYSREEPTVDYPLSAMKQMTSAEFYHALIKDS